MPPASGCSIRRPAPTAAICHNDVMAIGLLQACVERNVRVPRDLSIVGWDDVPYASLVTPPLTTVRVPRYELGQAAAERLLDSDRGPARRSRPGPPWPSSSSAARAASLPADVPARVAFGPKPTSHSSKEERGARVADLRPRRHDHQARADPRHRGGRKGRSMSDPEDTERAQEEHRGPSRRTMLRLGMLAISATQLPAIPAGAQAPKPGAHLIGKLEGAEVVTDPAQVPKRFSEAPQLAELVKAGKLPPVEQRIGQDPLVVKPLREIGRYGGTWRRGFTGPVRHLQRPPGRPERQAALLRLHRDEDRPEHRARVGGEPRRQGHDAPPAAGHEVERRAAVHGRRLRLLVRGRLPEQGARADAADRDDDQRQADRDPEGGRGHGPVRRARPLLRPPRRAGLGVGHRAPRAVRPGRAGRLRARPLPEAVPPQVHVQGRDRQEGRRAQRRQLGDALQEPQQRRASTPTCRS